MLKKKIILLGAGTHINSVYEIAENKKYKFCGFVGNLKSKNKIVKRYKYLGKEKYLETINKKNFYLLIAIGENSLRKKIFEKYKKKNFNFTTIYHPSSVVSKNSVIKDGCSVHARVIINGKTLIGKNCIINNGSIIEHNCKIGNHTHIAPGVKIAGNVSVGENCMIGIGSIVKNGVKIGKNVVIGAGSVITKNLSPNKTYIKYSELLK